MESLRQIGAGLLLGAISVVIVLGGFSLAMAEGNAALISAPAPTNTTVSIVVTIFPSLAPLVTNTPQGPGPVNTETPTVSPTPPPTLMNCPPPTGWLPIIVQANSTLATLAQLYRTSVELLRTNNCLINDQLVSGSILYVPPQPTSTLIPCGAPSGWGYYTVVPGDTLYHISQLYRVTVPQLMQANCLYTSNINAGRVLRVPNVPTSTPAVIDTPIPTSTEIPTFTLTPSQPPAATEVPSATDIPTGTVTPTEIAPPP